VNTSEQITNAAESASRRLGRRGYVLIFAAVIWLGQAGRIASEADPDPGHKLPLEYLSTEVRVAIWIAPAALAVTVAWCPPRWSRWGYVALVLPSAFRSFSYLISALQDPYAAGFWNAAIWAATSGIVVVCAGWPEETALRRFRRTRTPAAGPEPPPDFDPGLAAGTAT
jgi:hypothetical protein